MAIEDRLTSVEARLELVEQRLAQIIADLNESPKRSLRHPLGSINALHHEVGEVNEEFRKLVDELHRPSS